MIEDEKMAQSRKIVFEETGRIAIGEAVCCALMVGVYLLLGRFDKHVLLGAIAGFLLTVGNFFLMAVGTNLAADKAEQKDVGGGKKLIRSSMALRSALLVVLLFALVKSGLCDVLALALPLVFVRPVLMICEFFRKKG